MSPRFTRLFTALCWMGILPVFLVACSWQTKEQTIVSEAKETPISTALEDKPQLPDQFRFSKVSFISQEGMEIQLDVEAFQSKWNQYAVDLNEESFSFLKNHVYTIVAWDFLQQPNVIQVYEEGIKIGESMYINGDKIQFVQWLREHIGVEYMQQLEIKRLILRAEDLETKKELSLSLAEEIIQLLGSATLVKGEGRITSPLYPNYTLELEIAKDQQLFIQVLSPTLISIADGNDQWYYQLNQSIFSTLKKVVPVTYYSEQHIKHLFHAEDLLISTGLDVIQLSNQKQGTLNIESIIHHIVRQLAQAEKSDDIIVTTQETPVYQLTFLLAEEQVEVDIFEDHFLYKGKAYYYPSLQEKIEGWLKLVRII